MKSSVSSSSAARLSPLFALRDRAAQQWRSSTAQRAWQWWLAELQACLPPSMRRWLIHETVEQVYAWPLAEPITMPNADARKILLLPPSQVLVQTLQLPAAAARNLSTVVGYELDRFTPFEASQLYFVARHESRGNSFIEVTLVVIVRERLDRIRASCAALGLRPDAVDVGAGGQRMGIDLLPMPSRQQQARSGHRLRRGLVWLCGALLLSAMLLWLNDRQRLLEEMQAEVQRQRAQVNEIQQLRQQLTNTQGAASYLLRRKAEQLPLSALLSELTRCLPSDTWIEHLEINNGVEVAFSGQSGKASALIARAMDCHGLDNAQFQGVIQPDSKTGKDQYSMRAQLHQGSVDASSAE
jgi:general secretion pathway protein L